MKARTLGKPAKYESMNFCASSGVTPMSFDSVNADLAVEQRVVDHLGDAAQLVRIPPAVGAEDLERRPLVEVGPLRERGDEHRILGQVREHAELDLRVVGRDQHVAAARR